MAKTTLVMTGNEVFVQRLLHTQCPIDCWEDEYGDDTLWHFEFDIELCCNGHIGIIAVQKDEKSQEYEIIKSWRKPVTFDKALK